ncbi:hypothetical protein [Streptomyces avermitilis]|uniref:hypothetical protein n=1 Tax=Streptomyces avermitilis TaxID=33903 RepID=UPI003F4B13F8
MAVGATDGRFSRAVWTPGNHGLWTHPADPVQLYGVARYDALVELRRGSECGLPRTRAGFGAAGRDLSPLTAW